VRTTIEGGVFALYALVKKTKIKWLIVPAIMEEVPYWLIITSISVSSAVEELELITLT
jgi:KUP system potassium uptake protein